MGQFESFIGVDFWTALFVLLNTLAIFLVARKYLFNPVHRMITKRQEEIDGMYAAAGKARSDAEELAGQYQQKLSEAQAMSDRLVKEAAQRGQVRRDEIITQAQAEAEAIRSRAEADAAMEKKKAINDAKNEISGMAMAVAEKVIARELNAADQAALVEHFIDELDESGDEA